jgi:hypothetical protein
MQQYASAPSGGVTASLASTQARAPAPPRKETSSLKAGTTTTLHHQTSGFHLTLANITAGAGKNAAASLSTTLPAAISSSTAAAAAKSSLAAAAKLNYRMSDAPPATVSATTAVLTKTAAFHGSTTTSNPKACSADSWQPYGATRLLEQSHHAARAREATSSAKAQALGAVRGLEKEVKATVGYPVGANGIQRPGSASFLPPMAGASPADPSSATNTSSLFNRTAPITSQYAVNAPIAGVDDPFLHAHVNTSVTGQSTILTSQRLHDLAVSKQKRHFDALNAYTAWRSSFEQQLNEQVDAIASRLRLDLDALEKPIHVLLYETMADDDRLLRMDAQDIERAFENFHATYTAKSNAIRAGVRSLGEVEETRARECTDKLEQLVKTWLEVAHLPPAECERQLAQESKELNIYLLKNSATAHELGAVLESELVLKLRETNEKEWERKYAHWRSLRHEYYLTIFQSRFLTDFPEPGPIDERTGHERVGELEEREFPFMYSREKRRGFDQLQRVQQQFAHWSDEQIQAILRLTPNVQPVELHSKIEALTERMQAGYLDYDQRMDAQLQAVKKVEASLHQRAEAMVQTLLRDLLLTAAHPPEEIHRHISERIAPLLKERQAREKEMMDRVERSLKHFDSLYLRTLDHFSRFYLRAGESWDAFLLAMRERNTQCEELVAERRDKFDEDEAALEARIRDEIELLKCEPNMAALNARLAVLKTLVGPDGELEQAYRKFSEDSLVLSQQHPLALATVAQQHASSLAIHFGLRSPEEERKAEAARLEQRRREEEEAIRAEEEADALLTKREKAKKDKDKEKAKKDAESAEKAAADADAKAKLVKIREQAKAEEKAAKDAAAAEATPVTDGSASPASKAKALAAASSSTASAASSKQRKVTDDEVLATLAATEAADAALRSIESTLSSGVFYSLDRFREKSIRDANLVQLQRETPLEELGKVEIQSGELYKVEEEKQVETRAETQMTPEELRSCITYPQPPAAAIVAPIEDGKTKKKTRLSSPTKASAAAAALPAAPALPVAPVLVLPSDVVPFTLFLSQSQLLERILSGEKAFKKAHAELVLPEAPVDASIGLHAHASESSRSSASLHLSSLSGAAKLETSSEKEAREREEREQKEEKEAREKIEQAQQKLQTADRPASPATRAGSAKGGKKKSAKQRAIEEEEARLAALAEVEAAKAAELARQEAVRREAESIPLDVKGVELLSPLQFPVSLLSSLLDRLRENFLVTMLYEARAQIELCRSKNESIALDLVKECNLRLRVYQPRWNRLEVDHYELRAKQLNANLQYYNRFIERLTNGYGVKVAEWEGDMLKGEKEILLFSRRVKEMMDQLALLARDPHGQLASLHAINTQLKQHRFSFTKVMAREVFAPLTEGVQTFKQQLQGKIRAFLATCERKQFGAARAYAYINEHRDPTEMIDEIDADGNVVRVVAGASSAHSKLNQVELESYHPDEVAYYAGLLTEFGVEFEKLLVDQTTKVASLTTKYTNLLTLKDFNDAYAVNAQNLSVQQGLGHHNGAPKRRLTVALRSEFHTSQHQAAYINSLLDELERATKGLVKTGSAAAGGQKKTTTYLGDGEEKEQASTGHGGAVSFELDSNAAAPSSEVGAVDDLAASFGSLSLATPVAARAPNLTVHLLRTLDQLRSALLARAQYLQALKPNLPAFNMSAVSIDPELEAQQELARQKEEQAKKDERERKRLEEEQPSGRGSARGKRASLAAAGARLSTPEKPKTAEKRAVGASGSKRGAKGAVEEPEKPVGDLNASPRDTFLAIVTRSVEACRRDQAVLVAAYEAQFPERKQVKEKPPGSEEEQKEQEEATSRSKSGSNKKKDASSSSSGKKSARKSKEKDEKPEEVEVIQAPPAVEEHCQAELVRSQQHLEDATAELLKQSDRASLLLPSVSQTLLGDVFKRVVTEELAQGLDESAQAFQARVLTWTRASQRHRERLKPSIASRPDKNLLELVAREDARYSTAVEGIKVHRRRMLEYLKSNSSKFVSQLLHATTSLLQLLDSMVLPLDLNNVLKDGEALMAGRKTLKHLVKESHRLLATKIAIAESAGMIINDVGQLVPNPNAAVTSPTNAKRSTSAKKKTPSQLAAEAAEKASAALKSQDLLHRLDPRFLKLTWPGLRIDHLEQAWEDPEEREERRGREEREKEEQEKAAAEAARLNAGSRKKKRSGASISAKPSTPEEGASRPGSSGSGSGKPTAATVVSPPAGRRSKKQRAEDEAAALLAAQAAEAAAREAAVQTPAVTALNQPTQRAVITSRDAIYSQYVTLYQSQVSAVIDTCGATLAAERKARGEWEMQVAMLHGEPA